MPKLTPEQLAEIANLIEEAYKWADLQDIRTLASKVPTLLDHIKALEAESMAFRNIFGKIASVFHRTDLSYEERMRQMERLARDAVYDYHEGGLLKGDSNQ